LYQGTVINTIEDNRQSEKIDEKKERKKKAIPKRDCIYSRKRIKSKMKKKHE